MSTAKCAMRTRSSPGGRRLPLIGEAATRLTARGLFSSPLTRLLACVYYFLAEGHRYFGNRYGLRSEQEKALRALDRAILYNPHFARAYMERGILYWREMDDPQCAIPDLTLAYELAPELTEARFNRGIAHQQLGEYAEARADYEAYLCEGCHPYWREYAETMIRELKEWVSEPEGGCST
jgi:tetratricopeptide (TPR) repeat protein